MTKSISKVEEASGSNGRSQARRPPSRYGALDIEKAASFKKKKKKSSSTEQRMPYKGSFPKSSTGRAKEGSQPSPSKSAGGSQRLPSNGREQKARRKIAQRDMLSHKSVFDNLPDGTLLYYKIGKKKKRFGGQKKGSGIFCDHCKKEISPTQFEAHAGFRARRQPYLNICTLDGLSLHQIYQQKLKETKLVEGKDDNCFICEGRDKDDLIHCGKCRRAFHTECVSQSCKTVGIWHCTYCTNRSGRKTKQRTNQCTTESSGRGDIGSCVLCSKDHFDDSDGFCSQTIILCSQCGKEYHVGCLKDRKIEDLKELPKGPWFCKNEQCGRIYQALQESVANGEQELPEPALNRIKMSSGDPVIRWRLLQGKMASHETRNLFSQAIYMFHVAFGFMEGPNSIDLFPDMVYGRSVLNYDFDGMHCALLMVNSVIVSAAILRVYGDDIAEIPMAATRMDCKGQGYFTALFSCIENLLASLKVKDIVVPVAKDAATYWKNKLGFVPITEDELKHYQDKYFTLMQFEDTGVLHRSVEQPLNCKTAVDG